MPSEATIPLTLLLLVLDVVYICVVASRIARDAWLPLGFGQQNETAAYEDDLGEPSNWIELVINVADANVVLLLLRLVGVEPTESDRAETTGLLSRSLTGFACVLLLELLFAVWLGGVVIYIGSSQGEPGAHVLRALAYVFMPAMALVLFRGAVLHRLRRFRSEQATPTRLTSRAGTAATRLTSEVSAGASAAGAAAGAPASATDAPAPSAAPVDPATPARASTRLMSTRDLLRASARSMSTRKLLTAGRTFLRRHKTRTLPLPAKMPSPGSAAKLAHV